MKIEIMGFTMKIVYVTKITQDFLNKGQSNLELQNEQRKLEVTRQPNV